MKTLFAYKNMLADLDLLAEDNLDAAGADVEVADVSYNSLLVRPGTLFLCKGANFKAAYLQDALDKGAIGYVAAQKLDMAFADGREVPYMLVKDLRAAISKISAFYFGRSWDEGLKLIGLTGTKGKSTTAAMIKSIMDVHCGREIGFSSGIYTYDGEHREKSRKLTTPETIELHRILDGCVRNNCQYLAMEVSSQGLKYDRVADLHYEICAFLNISEDHISDAEHSDMEDYFTSKLKIFDRTRLACVNMDMDRAYVQRVLDAAKKGCEKVITFGFCDKVDVKGTYVKELPGALEVGVLLDGQEEVFQVNIGGDYNGSNALAAIAITRALGVSCETIRQGLAQVKVAGRMETYSLDRGVDVIVDCAHNKLSYEALFDYVRHQYPGRKVGFLFGCVGGKAYNRRQEAGEIADQNADFIIITERDPGPEPVEQICQDIYQHVAHKEKARIITDRDEAVEAALKQAEELGDCVLILAGCGSDAYVKRGTQLVEFATDGERVVKYLDAREK